MSYINWWYDFEGEVNVKRGILGYIGKEFRATLGQTQSHQLISRINYMHALPKTWNSDCFLNFNMDRAVGTYGGILSGTAICNHLLDVILSADFCLFRISDFTELIVSLSSEWPWYLRSVRVFHTTLNSLPLHVSNEVGPLMSQSKIICWADYLLCAIIACEQYIRWIGLRTAFFSIFIYIRWS